MWRCSVDGIDGNILLLFNWDICNGINNDDEGEAATPPTFHLLLHCPLVRSGTWAAIAFQFFPPNCLTAAVNNESSSRVHGVLLCLFFRGSDDEDDDEDVDGMLLLNWVISNAV